MERMVGNSGPSGEASLAFSKESGATVLDNTCVEHDPLWGLVGNMYVFLGTVRDRARGRLRFLRDR